MPGKPFSGKQKKEQLKAKRLQKAEKSKLSSSDSESLDEKDRPSGVAAGAPRPSGAGSHPVGMEGDLLTYGGDKGGVRSVFQRESSRAIEARKRLACQPLIQRDFTPGVPFGHYFTMLGVDVSNLEEQHYSTTIPVTIALPTRASRLTPEARRRITFESSPVVDASHESEQQRCVASSRTDAAQRGPSSDDSDTEHDDYNDKDKASKTKRKGEAGQHPVGRNTSKCHPRKPPNAIEAEEERVFADWVHRVDAQLSQTLPTHLRGMEVNSFERNLDVWRQLWRTTEMSDVVVVVADSRYPIIHLPVALLHYIIVQEKKRCVICLNKGDLVAPTVLAAWRAFLGAYLVAMGICKAADDVPIIVFTSLPEMESALGSEQQRADKRRKGKARTQKAYEDMKQGRRSVKSLADELSSANHDGSDDSSEASSDDEDRYDATENFKGKERAEKQLAHGKREYKELAAVAEMIDNLLTTCKRVAQENGAAAPSKEHITIGFVGHPNVGKSSLLNCVRGTKVVSVSATAGHTKHLQTIPVPSDGVTLVDCPGLAFPVLGLPRPLQAVIGTHQVAQTRDPQSGVAYLAARLPLERIYGLRRVDGDVNEPWSAYDLCESYGNKKGFFVKRGRGIVDIHRSAIAILQEAYEGRLVLYFQPPPVQWLTSDAFRQEWRPHLLLCPQELQF